MHLIEVPSPSLRMPYDITGTLPAPKPPDWVNIPIDLGAGGFGDRKLLVLEGHVEVCSLEEFDL